MKNISLVILLVLACLTSTISKAGGLDASNRYRVCNFYTDSMCFGLVSGDEITVAIPVDYVLHELSLGFGVSATIYIGFNPSELGENMKKYPLICTGKFFVCEFYKSSPSTYYFRYQEEELSTILDVHFRNINKSNIRNFEDFLRNWRTCRAKDNDINCSDEVLLPNFKLDA